MANSSEIDALVRRMKDVPDFLLRAKACPECLAVVPADQGAITGHAEWHVRTGTGVGR